MIVMVTALLTMAQLLNPPRILGSYTFTFNGHGIMKIERVVFQERLFNRLYYLTPLSACSNADTCTIAVQGLFANIIPSGTLWQIMDVKFKVLTDIPPRYAALKRMLGETAEHLFIMCTLIPSFGNAVNTVKGGIGRFLAYGVKSFYFFSVAPYGVQLKPGDTVEMAYFMSTTPTDVALIGRRAVYNQCKWGGPYLAVLPDVYNFGGITSIQMSWGTMIPNAIKPKSYWDYPKNIYMMISIKGNMNYPNKETLSSIRGPSGLIAVPPLQAAVSLTSVPAALPGFKPPAGYTAAVLQTFEVGYQRKCPGDVDLDGKYTMKDFEIVACMTNMIKNTTYCNSLMQSLPKTLVDLFSMTGDVTQDGTVNSLDAMVLLSLANTTCPYGDYAKYIYGAK